MKKDLAYYKSLPYSLTVERFEEEEDGEFYFRAQYRELPRVEGVHQDRLVAIRLAKELFDAYVETLLEWGEEIPEPDVRRFRKRGGLFKFEAVEASPSEGSPEADAAQVQDGNFPWEDTGADTAGARVAV